MLLLVRWETQSESHKTLGDGGGRQSQYSLYEARPVSTPSSYSTRSNFKRPSVPYLLYQQKDLEESNRVV
jgi:hypothetical protein